MTLDDVDSKCVELLKELTVDDALNVLGQFERSVLNGGVKNKSAYLAGGSIAPAGSGREPGQHAGLASIRSLLVYARSSRHDALLSLSGVATRHKHFGHGPKLIKEVQQRLETLYRAGKLRDAVRPQLREPVRRARRRHAARCSMTEQLVPDARRADPT